MEQYFSAGVHEIRLVFNEPDADAWLASLRAALEHLMKTGEYKAIATTWGVEKGMIDAPVINGATR